MGEIDKMLDEVVERVAARVVELMTSRGAGPRAASPVLVDRLEVGRILGVSPATVDRFCREGLPHVYVGASRRFVASEVVAWFSTRPRRGAASQGTAPVGVELRTRRA